MKPLALDLYCGAGGAALGYHRAGFQVLGVDIAPQKDYPFSFVQADALTFLSALDPSMVDFVHASPPCQRYSDLAARNPGHEYPDLVGPTRELLQATGLPYVIENVPEAPLLNPLILCGTMFAGLRVIRHRGFESNLTLTAPRSCTVPHPRCHTLDKRKAHYGLTDEWVDFVTVTGGGNCSVAAARDAMGLDHVTTKYGLNEAIPPAYTEHIGTQVLAEITLAVAA